MADCNVDEVLAAVGPEFTRAKAIRALKEADGDVEEAVAWLLEQDSSSSSSSEDMTIERENINQSETERPGTPKKADAKNAILKGREGTMTKMHLETKANLEHSQEGQKNKDAVLDGESSLSRKEFDQHHHRDDHSPKIAMQPVRSSKKLIAPVGIAKPSPMGILLGEDVDDLSVPSMSYPPSSSSYFPLEDFVALMEQSGVSVWPGTRMKTKGSSLSSSSFPPAAVVSALSRLYTYNMGSSSSSVEVGIRRFDFSTPSPDDIACDKRRTRLDNAKTRVKSTRTKRGGHQQSMAPPRRERSVEREVREELERDRIEELARLGVHSDHDLGMSSGGRASTKKKNSGLSGRGEPRDEKAKQAGIKARKKNRNSKMNRRKRNF
mmetsp:Transcript_15560/g.25349  ORF Transcript_15560/g.25349 Transcript_15560/m.25349 type:complete len:380 (+) Transcript_15560:45-1184(+)